MDTLTAPGNQRFNPSLLDMSEKPVSILPLDFIILEHIKLRSALLRRMLTPVDRIIALPVVLERPAFSQWSRYPRAYARGPQLLI